jgi:hypothetical protein
MSEPTQPTIADVKRQLDEVVLGLQRLRPRDGGDGNGGGEQGLSTQSNGCSTYSIHCGTAPPEVVAQQ